MAKANQAKSKMFPNRLAVQVASRKGGCSKTSTAVSLSTYFHEGRQDDQGDYLPPAHTLLVDLDAGQGSAFKWMLERIDSDRRFGNYRAFATFRDWEEPEEVCFDVVRAFSLDEVERIIPKYDYLVIDGRPQTEDVSVELAKRCHLTVLPTACGKLDLWPTVELAKKFKANQIRNFRIALHRVPAIGAFPTGEYDFAVTYLETFESARLVSWVPHRTTYSRAAGYGYAMQEVAYGSLSERVAGQIEEIEIAAQKYAPKAKAKAGPKRRQSKTQKGQLELVETGQQPTQAAA